MQTAPISQQVRAFVVENYLFGRDEGLGDEDSFLEAGVIDSTGVLELVAFLEERFGVKVANDELITDNLDSIQKVTAYLQSKLEAAPVMQERSR